MNARLSHVLSRLSIVTVVAASSLGAAACARGGSSTDSSTEPTAAAAEQQVAAAEQQPAAEPQAEQASQHRPGRWLFRQVEQLDLRADQRAALADVETNLVADLAPHRQAMRQITLALADAIEQGQLDDAKAEENRQALIAAVSDAKIAFGNAINSVHDTLDAGQRATLVEQLRQQHEGRAHGQGGAEAPKHGLAKLAFELGLSEEQQAQIRDAIQQGVDEMFPDRAARREAHEAKMKAMAAAFLTEEFDAADYDIAEHAEETVGSFVAITSRAIDLSGTVLSDSQRKVAADLIRDKAEKI